MYVCVKRCKRLYSFFRDFALVLLSGKSICCRCVVFALYFLLFCVAGIHSDCAGVAFVCWFEGSIAFTFASAAVVMTERGNSFRNIRSATHFHHALWTPLTASYAN